MMEDLPLYFQPMELTLNQDIVSQKLSPTLIPNGGEVTTIQFGQYAQKMTLSDSLSPDNLPTLQEPSLWGESPILKNPSVLSTALKYNLTLMEYPSSTYYGINSMENVPEH